MDELDIVVKLAFEKYKLQQIDTQKVTPNDNTITESSVKLNVL